ncbi:hypothetical protein [Bacillus piscicola]|uniref:hypothetical protein n=1 Tax=Bacillus piscicola TaxID=1632684 RepID=UPI001F091444|nr:hypothetical protein [Bacillus piscicola]
MGVWQVGPFLIQKEWLILLGAYVLSLGIVRWLFPAELGKKGKKERQDLHVNSLFLFLITYQLSSFLFYIPRSWQDPVAVLATPGTWKEWSLASLAAVVYVGIKSETTRNFYEVALYLFQLFLLMEFLYAFAHVYIQADSGDFAYHMLVNGVVLFMLSMTRRRCSYQCSFLMGVGLYALFKGIMTTFISVKILFVYMPVLPFMLTIIITGTVSVYDLVKKTHLGGGGSDEHD